MPNFDTLHVNARRASAMLKAMSNERRLRILCFLAEGERSVGDLEEAIGLSQSALSQHLARLRHDNLVKTRRSAQTVFYSLNGQTALTIMDSLQRLYGLAACVDTAPPDQRPIDPGISDVPADASIP